MWYENVDGSAGSWTSHVIARHLDDVSAVYAIDVDGDGDIDVLSATQGDDTVAWYENNDSSGTSWTKHVITSSAVKAIEVFAIDVDGDGDVDVLSASRTDDTVAWYVYLVRGCGHRHEERKIPIRLGMSERQKDGDECIRAMVENRRENTRRTPAGRSLSLAHQVREPLRELLRGDARAGPVADARADPGADAGSNNAPADAARELATRRLLRRRRRAGGSCSTSRSRRTRRRRSMRPSRPRACSCRATGCGSRADLARAGLSPRFFSLWGFR